jgi:hypothetical protein
MSAVNSTTAQPMTHGARRRAIFLLLTVAVFGAFATSSATASAAPAIGVSTLIPDHVIPGKSMVMFVTI